MANELTDVTVELRHETEKAYLVTDGDKEVWIPKSMCEIERMKGNTVELTLPAWLAKKEGLI